MESSNSPRERLWNMSFIMMMLITTLSAFSFYTNQTVLSKYLKVEMGLTITLAGTIVGLFSLTSLVFRPFCGIMSDRLNKVKLMLLSNVLMAIGLIGFAFACTVPMIIMMRIINGIGFAIGSTAQVALCTSFIPNSRMGEGIGYMGLTMVLASAAAPGLGIAISSAMGMKSVFLVSAVMPIIGCILLIFMRERSPVTAKGNQVIRIKDMLEWRAWPFSLCGGMFSFTNGIINAYIVLFSEAIGIGEIGLYFTAYSICLFIIRPLSGKLMDRKGIRLAVLPAILITAVSMIILSVSTSLLMVVVSAVFRAIGQGMAQPSLQAGSINYIGKERSGVATSTYYLFGDVGQGIGPMIGGLILQSIVGLSGYRLLFYICAGLFLIGFVVFERFSRQRITTSVKTNAVS